MNTLDYILKKYSIQPSLIQPVEIPNVGKDDLAKLLKELDIKTGVEVGVAEGLYSRKLCEANPQMRLFGVDSWELYGDYKEYGADEVKDLYRKAKGNLKGVKNSEMVIASSIEAIRRFADDSLDFVYIDANHEEKYAYQDIAEWSKKVRPGGIISGHDYFKGRAKNGKLFGVIEAVSRYTKEYGITPWFVLGLSTKDKGMVRDPSRSWFWVK